MKSTMLAVSLLALAASTSAIPVRDPARDGRRGGDDQRPASRRIEARDPGPDSVRDGRRGGEDQRPASRRIEARDPVPDSVRDDRRGGDDDRRPAGRRIGARGESWSEAAAPSSTQGWADSGSSSYAPSYTQASWSDHPAPTTTSGWTDETPSSTPAYSWADSGSSSSAPSYSQASWSDHPVPTSSSSGWTDATPSSAPPQSWSDTPAPSSSSQGGSWSDTPAPSATTSASGAAYTLYWNTAWNGEQDKGSVQRYSHPSDADGTIQVTFQENDILRFVKIINPADNANCVVKDAQGNQVRAFGGPAQTVDSVEFDEGTGKQAHSVSCSLAK